MIDLTEAIRKRINNLMKENDLNESKLSTLAGVSRSTISRFLKEERKYLRIDVIEYICEGLGIKLKDFFDDPLFDNIEIKE